ncbi:hypothetical protein N7532_002224 [Penicillium argentinense]|uniref:Uncharacterized protein n=1 Tax=Penicillium argentinense TaxID=1131581 RepID=A0A9W9G019_9EURO|nr:uncharacterized protein N7532_002224 [Penicillium argentinense]KAJ5109579.1 hypothetical protein N7532_002224 [Penicillium argentinense]
MSASKALLSLGIACAGPATGPGSGIPSLNAVARCIIPVCRQLPVWLVVNARKKLAGTRLKSILFMHAGCWEGQAQHG